MNSGEYQKMSQIRVSIEKVESGRVREKCGIQASTEKRVVAR